MTSAEAKLRAATERTAAEFTEVDLSPLRLAATTHHAAVESRSGRRGETGGTGGPRLRSGLAAFGAAAAMLAVFAGSLVLAGYFRHGERTSRPRDMTASEVMSGPLAGMPRYFIELHRDRTGEQLARRAAVIDSVTGRVLASVPVPEPYVSFSGVAGAADDRTFVLGAERWPQARKNAITPLNTKLFELRIGLRRSGRVTIHLAPIGLRIPVNWEGQGLALSPDGTRLAFAASPLTKAVIIRIWVYSMTTGTVRSWQSPGEIGREPWDVRSLSWSPDDRTLAYLWETNFDFDRLDTTSASGRLLDHSRKLIGFTSALDPTHDVDLTPDGRTVIASIDVHSGGRIDEFSAASGQLIRAITPAGLGRTRLLDVLWANSSGTLMIVELNAALNRPHSVLLLRGTKLTPVTSVPSFVDYNGVAW